MKKGFKLECGIALVSIVIFCCMAITYKPEEGKEVKVIKTELNFERDPTYSNYKYKIYYDTKYGAKLLYSHTFEKENSNMIIHKADISFSPMNYMTVVYLVVAGLCIITILVFIFP